MATNVTTWEIEVFYDEYAPPTITSISPAQGVQAGGTSITITGTNLDATDATSRTVKIDGNLCTSLTSITSTSITCVTPSGSAGAKDVIVEVFYNSGTPGTAVTLAESYTYATPPTVTSINPTFGTNSGGDSVTIRGTFFSIDNPDSVAGTIGGAAITSLSVVDDTRIVGNTPSGSDGARDVVITATYNTVGLSGTFTGGFTYQSIDDEKTIGTTAGTEKTIATTAGTEKTISAASGTEKLIATVAGTEKIIGSASGTEKTIPDVSGTEKVIETVAGTEKTIPDASGTEKTIPAASGTEKLIATVAGTEKTIPAATGTEKTI